VTRALASAYAVALGLAVASATHAAGAEPNADARLAPPSPQPPPVEEHVSVYSLAALGVTGSGFVNALAGARFELAYAPRVTLGFGAAYANLKGQDGRASNVLPEALVGYELPLGRVVSLPFRCAGGYLPKNGPTLRVGTGVTVRFDDAVHLELTLLEPMIWVTQDRPEVSFDFGGALSFRL